MSTRTALLFPALALALPAAALIVLSHCGGQTSSPASPDAAGAEASALDAPREAAPDVFEASLPDVHDAAPDVLLVVCPVSPPAVGSSCFVPDQECEYGPSFFLDCNELLRCTQGSWTLQHGALPCSALDAGLQCPATFAEASTEDAGIWPGNDQACQYPDGYCECPGFCGGGQVRHPEAPFGCNCVAATSSCPSPRPLIGTACEDDSGTRCTYGGVCCSGETLTCVQGVWTGFGNSPCP
jgi:hypothetical protein